MFEADSHLKLHPTFILDIYNVFEHIDMLSIGIQQQPYTVILTQLGSDFGVLGHLWSQNDVLGLYNILDRYSRYLRTSTYVRK